MTATTTNHTGPFQVSGPYSQTFDGCGTWIVTADDDKTLLAEFYGPMAEQHARLFASVRRLVQEIQGDRPAAG